MLTSYGFRNQQHIDGILTKLNAGSVEIKHFFLFTLYIYKLLNNLFPRMTYVAKYL